MLKAEEYAREIIEKRMGKKAVKIKRFSTGLSHFVFDILADGDFPCVIRIAKPERAKEFVRGLFWHKEIGLLGVRLPQIYEVGEIKGHHFAVYERLQGEDLEKVYSALSAQEKRNIAEEIAETQQKVSALNRSLFEQIYSWKEVLLSIVSRSEREILSHGLCNPKYVNLVRRQIERHEEYIETVEPATFLYDLSVRNVIVDNGKITGIIDVDDVWFGDPLLAIGRGKTILFAMKQDIDFIEYWSESLRLSEREKEMIELYALLYSVRFMGTIGTRLNGNPSMQTNPANARLFENIARSILAGLENRTRHSRVHTSRLRR